VLIHAFLGLVGAAPLLGAAGAPAVPAGALVLQLERGAPVEIPDDYERRVTPEVLVARFARPAVVHITTDVADARFNIFGQPVNRGGSAGSGVVIFEDGFVVTNYHVVRRAQNIRVRFDDSIDRTEYRAQLVSAVPEEDLALLKIDATGPFPTVPLGTSADIMIGERVVAIGNPYGQTFTVSTGIVSGLHRDVVAEDLRFTDLIQTDASINPGNSGGPLLNINGRLIGINTVMNSAAQNIGFAIPVDRVKQVLEDHLLSPSMARAWFGYDIDESSLVVSEVMPGSPAADGGLSAGDRIVAIGDRRIAEPGEYPLARLPLLPGRPVTFAVEREGKPVEFPLVGWERHDALLYQRMGLIVEPVALRGRIIQRALRVKSLREGGPAARLGVEVGDFIEAVRPDGGRAYPQIDAVPLAILVNQLPATTALTIDLWRDSNRNGNRDWDASFSEFLQGSLTLD